MNSVRTEDIRPYILEDIRPHETCSFVKFLEVMLERIRKPGCNKSGKEICEELVQLVLPIANDNVESSEVKKNVKGLRDNLEAYLSAGTETRRYAPFVGAVHHALQALQTISFSSVKEPSAGPAMGATGARRNPLRESAAKRSRTSDDLSDRPAKRVAAISKSTTPPAECQVADYAAEYMFPRIGRCHVLNFIIRDQVISAWFFDHEGPIQTTGLDFVADLPYFLVLLLVLQRFSPCDWGLLPGFQHESQVTIPHSESFTFSEDEKHGRHRHYALSGCCTQVMRGSAASSDDDPFSAALKLSYPEGSRRSEGHFIDQSCGRCSDMHMQDVLDCLPDVRASIDYEAFSTTSIRLALGLPIRAKRPRIPRLILLPQYVPLTNIPTDEDRHMSAFWKLLCCHWRLWIVGIQYGDISVGNLMYDEVHQTPKLCDYDLSHDDNDERPAGFTNTGTPLFMALDLLNTDAMDGKVERVYRHDAESFGWVLIWIFARFKNGQELKNPPFENWKNKVFGLVENERRQSLTKLPGDPKPDWIPGPLWIAACFFLIAVTRLAEERIKAKQDCMLAQPLVASQSEFEQIITRLDSPGVVHRIIEKAQGLLKFGDGSVHQKHG